jgi:hypothetical protein
MADRRAIGRIELHPLGEIIIGILAAQRAREHDNAHRLLVRSAARARDAGDRHRDIGIAVRQHARGHGPGGRQRYLTKGFQNFAADVELALLGVGRIGDESGAEDIGTTGNVSERHRHHAAGAAFGDGNAAPRRAIGGKNGRGGFFARGLARFDGGRQGSILRKF